MHMARDTQSRRTTITRVLVLLTLAMTGMVAAATARAEVTTNEQVPLHFAGYVPCANGGAGEIVSGAIEMHNLIASTSNDNHPSDQFQFQAHGSMVGAITGDTYRVAGVTRGTSSVSLQNDHYGLTYVNSFHLVGAGPGNNLLVHETAHVLVNGDNVVVQHDNLSIDCK